MSLSCYCDEDWQPEGRGQYWALAAPDYSILQTKRAKRCCSCGTLIHYGETVLRIERTRPPLDDIEIKIYREDGEIPYAAAYQCETCADLYFSLVELGFCVWPEDDMRQLVYEYATTYGPAR